MGKGKRQGPARKHHFVPAAYLGQFAQPRGRLGRLFVFDSKSRKSWTGTPETQARLMDLYTVEGEEPDRVEKALATAEGELLPALQRIEKGTRSHADVAKVACFVALQSIRGPERLDATREFMEEVANMTLSMATHSKKAFDASTARVKMNNPSFDPEEMPTFEEMHTAVKNGEIKFEAQPGAVIGMTLSVLDSAFGALMARRNVIAIGADAELITSSHPVLISGAYPGLLTADAVLMAISPKMLFMSLPGEPGSDWTPAPPGLFAQFNTLLAHQSQMVFGSESAVMKTVNTLLEAEARGVAVMSRAEVEAESAVAVPVVRCPSLADDAAEAPVSPAPG